MNITTRTESPSDAASIDAVVAAAFLHAPHTSHTEQFIVRALREAGVLAVSLVAEDEDGIVGHVAVSPVTISDATPGWYGLGPLAVLPQHQGRGIGSLLMRQALARLRALGAAGCVVLGEPAYYRRFGFQAVPGLTLPGVPAEYFLAIRFGGALPAGHVAYHAAFGATD